MRTVKNESFLSREVIFEPGNATRYHLVLSFINKDTLVVADLNEKKAIILDPEFPSVESYIHTFKKYEYGESDARGMAEFIVGVLEQQ